RGSSSRPASARAIARPGQARPGRASRPSTRWPSSTPAEPPAPACWSWPGPSGEAFARRLAWNWPASRSSSAPASNHPREPARVAGPAGIHGACWHRERRRMLADRVHPGNPAAKGRTVMPTFRKSPPELVARFDELASLAGDADRKQMFGYPTCVLRGNMFMGLHEDSLILRLAEPDPADVVSRCG